MIKWDSRGKKSILRARILTICSVARADWSNLDRNSEGRTIVTGRSARGVPRIEPTATSTIGKADQTSKSSAIYGTADVRNPP